jgi:hypothetical protein
MKALLGRLFRSGHFHVDVFRADIICMLRCVRQIKKNAQVARPKIKIDDNNAQGESMVNR